MEGREPRPLDRVRVRSVAACPERATRHWDGEQGRTGQVIRVSRTGDATHPFDVRFDELVERPDAGSGGTRSVSGNFYAASELETLAE